MKLALVLCLTLVACSSVTSSHVSPNDPPANRNEKTKSAPEASEELNAPMPLATSDLPTLTKPEPKTRYQVMQEGFNRSSYAPSISDFDRLDESPGKMKCYSAKSAAPNIVSEMVIKQMSVPVAATADYGPLFPGAPEHEEMRLVIGKNNGWVNSTNLTPEIRQVFELTKVAGSLVIQIKDNKFGIYQDIGAPAEVWIRKDAQNRIFFKVFRLNLEKVRNEVFIGYCFQNAAQMNVNP